LGLGLIYEGDEAERLETIGAATRWLPDMAASTMGVERQSDKAPAPERHTRCRRERSNMERVAIIARLKEGREQRAAELVGAGSPFDLATAAGGRSESWA
jgi:hypothetical protein